MSFLVSTLNTKTIAGCECFSLCDIACSCFTKIFFWNFQICLIFKHLVRTDRTHKYKICETIIFGLVVCIYWGIVIDRHCSFYPFAICSIRDHTIFERFSCNSAVGYIHEDSAILEYNFAYTHLYHLLTDSNGSAACGVFGYSDGDCIDLYGSKIVIALCGENVLLLH